MADVQMTFLEHLSELRRRLLWCVLVIVAGACATYILIDQVVEVIILPAEELQFVYLTPPELFLAYLRISLISGVVVASPFVLLQAWLFVRPALTKAERIFTIIAVVFGTLFFAAGVVFSFFVIFPFTMRFFLQYATETIEPMFSFGSYIGFLSSIVLAFGISFEFPILVLILARSGVIDVATLRKSRKFVFLSVVILAAILTPPDVVSQILLAGPLMILFEISILAARLLARHEARMIEEEAVHG